jgi:hypothetical protein
MMGGGLTVFEISEVKKQLKYEPLHQALLKGLNNVKQNLG